MSTFTLNGTITNVATERVPARVLIEPLTTPIIDSDGDTIHVGPAQVITDADGDFTVELLDAVGTDPSVIVYRLRVEYAWTRQGRSFPIVEFNAPGDGSTLELADLIDTTAMFPVAPDRGMPPGGADGQHLAKASGADYDTEWVPADVSPPDASTTVKGIVELATSSETTTGTDTVRATTPAGVKAVSDLLVPLSAKDTDVNLAANSDAKIASQKATKAYADAWGSYLSSLMAAYVPKSLYDANTILAATTDDIPAALTIAASRIVGRKATGDIGALTTAELAALFGTPTGAKFLADDGTLKTPSGGAGILGYKKYASGGTSYTSTAGGSMSDVDATNLAVTFTAPASGAVLIQLDALAASNDGNEYAWGIRESTTTLTQGSAVNHGSAAWRGHVSMLLVVTGLSAGSHTYKWAHTKDAAGNGTMWAATTLPATMVIHALP